MAPDNYVVDINDSQDFLEVDSKFIKHAVCAILQGENIGSAEISLAIVDNATIHQLNRKYLKHDYATDVLSFVLEKGPNHLMGEIVASGEMAQQVCGRYNWSANDELTMYVVHGTLHLVGLEDQTAAQCADMRSRENLYLDQLGIRPAPGDEAAIDARAASEVALDGDLKL